MTNKSSINGTLTTNQQWFNTTVHFSTTIVFKSISLSADIGQIVHPRQKSSVGIHRGSFFFFFWHLSLVISLRLSDIINENIHRSCLLPSTNLHIFT